jgi:hypothetical protein
VLFLAICKKKKQTERDRGFTLLEIEEEQQYKWYGTKLFWVFYAKSNFSLLLCASEGISPRLPIALPILYTSSKAISVGTKPIATNITASPRFIT